MILSVGEILVDMIAEVKDDNVSYLRKAGGAPFNVACGINKLGGKTAFVGAVGDDIPGHFLVDFAKNQNLDGILISIDKSRNTTLAFVDIDKSGERSFGFYRKNTADYHLPLVSEELFNKASIIHIGSLMLSTEIGYKYAMDLIIKAKAVNKLISFDVNYRTDIFPNENEAILRYKAIIEKANIVKLSSDEVSIFKEDYVDEISKGRLVCITLGPDGSKYLYDDLQGFVKTIKVKPIDTTGAGDAFYAGLLTELDGLTKDKWTKEVLDNAFLFGNVCGALNTQGLGAINHFPSLLEVNKYIDLFKKTNS